MDNQAAAEAKRSGFIIEVPEGTMSKYLTPSEGRQILAGELMVKGSCVPYHHLVKYEGKQEKLAAIHADRADKFGKEAGLCQYLFPFREGLGIAPCDNELKPHWQYPFTGNGFIPTTDGSIALLYYLTQELTPEAGHVLIFFADDGQVEKVSLFLPASQAWVDAEEAEGVGADAPVKEMERDELDRLVRDSLEKQARPEEKAGEDAVPLSAWRRFRLLCRNPRQAFARMTEEEAKRDAWRFFFLYFMVMLPVQVHQFVFQGKLHSLKDPASWLVIGGGLLGGMIMTAFLFLLGATVLHLLLNRAMGCGRRFMDALTLPMLCLAPQLTLVVQYPLLLWYWGTSSAYVAFLFVRIVAALLSLRVCYWGLRTWFGLSTSKTFLVMALPLVAMALFVVR